MRPAGMLGAMSVRSVGVEEELLLVEPETGQPQAVAGSVMEAVSQAAGAAAAVPAVARSRS